MVLLHFTYEVYRSNRNQGIKEKSTKEVQVPMVQLEKYFMAIF